MTGESNKNRREAAEDPAVVYSVVCGGIDSRSGPVDPEQIGVDLVAFAVDFRIPMLIRRNLPVIVAAPGA